MEMNKGYPAYKPSGVEWIGNIPEHWFLRRLKYNTYIKARVGWHGLKSTEFTTEGPYCVTGTDFVAGCIDWSGCYRVPQERFDEDPFIQLKSGDLLITKDGTIGKTAVVGELPGLCTLNSGVFVVRPEKDYKPRFLYWVLNSSVFTEYVNYYSKGSTIIHLYQDNFCNLPQPIPPRAEQQAIAAYLDEKTALIHETIRKKQQLIELLQEERTALINQAVTRGLDPNVPMKHSGLEWLGEIPPHWEVKRVKYLVKKVGSGVTPKGGAEVYKTSGVPLLRSQNVYCDGLRMDDVAYITKDVHRGMSNSSVLVGDVLLNITGASIGRCYYVEDWLGEANVNQHVCILRPNEKVHTKYMFYFLSSAFGQLQIDLLQNGANREGLNYEQLKNFVVPLPSSDEQVAIINGLESILSKMGPTIEKVEQEITLLQEYRTALINEVVTGKRCVVPQPEALATA